MERLLNFFLQDLEEKEAIEIGQDALTMINHVQTNPARSSQTFWTKLRSVFPKKTPPTDFFQSLPDEIILKILSHLKIQEIATVESILSRRFRRLCLDATLWTSLDLPSEENLTHKKAMELITRCPQLKTLKLRQRIDSVVLAQKALVLCEKLTELDIRVYADLEGLLTVIANHGHCLYKLCLFGNWDNDVLTSQAHCLERISYLKVGGSNFNDSSLMSIADNCRQLEKIVTVYADNISLPAMIYFLQKTKDKIKSVRIEKTITSGLLLKHIGDCAELEELHIEPCSMLTASGLSSELEEISRLPKLKHLSMRSVQISMTSLICCFGEERLKHLLGLTIFGHMQGNRGLRLIADNCPELTFLYLVDGGNISSEDIRYLLFKCRKLKRVKLVGWTGLTRDVIRAIPAGSKSFLKIVG